MCHLKQAPIKILTSENTKLSEINISCTSISHVNC